MLVFIVVLELYVQYAPTVISESFTLSVFAAVVLKVLIDAISGLERHAAAWFSRREGAAWRVLGLVTTFLILFLSKFVVLEVIDIIFGARVTLGGFVQVAALVVTMILARLAVRRVYRWLGQHG